MFRPQLQSMTDRKSALDDRDYASFAWARYRRILKWMTLAAALAGLAAIGILSWMGGGIHWIPALGAFMGVFVTVLMAAALMGLVFLSSGSGHDESVSRASEDQSADRTR